MAKSVTLYHSKLVEMTSAGAILVRIKSEPKPSKFKGKMPYCYLLIDGQEYAYNVENGEIGMILEQYVGQDVAMQAGGRDASAYIEIFAAEEAGQPPQDGHQFPAESPDDGLGPEPPPPPPRRQPARPTQSAPPRRQPAQRADEPPQQETAAPSPKYVNPSHAAVYEEGVEKVKKQIGRRRNLMKLCVRAARSINEDFAKMDLPGLTTEQVHGIASSIYIDMVKDRALCDQLPYGQLENYEGR